MFDNSGSDSGRTFPAVFQGVTIEDIEEFRHYVCWERHIPFNLLFDADTWPKEKWDEYIKKWTDDAY